MYVICNTSEEQPCTPSLAVGTATHNKYTYGFLLDPHTCNQAARLRAAASAEHEARAQMLVHMQRFRYLQCRPEPRPPIQTARAPAVAANDPAHLLARRVIIQLTCIPSSGRMRLPRVTTAAAAGPRDSSQTV